MVCSTLSLMSSISEHVFTIFYLGQMELPEVAKLFDKSTLLQLKNECGGLQTLLRNHYYIFKGEFKLDCFEIVFNMKQSNIYVYTHCIFSLKGLLKPAPLPIKDNKFLLLLSSAFYFIFPPKSAGLPTSWVWHFHILAYMKGVDGRSVVRSYSDVITKIYRIDGFAPPRAPSARWAHRRESSTTNSGLQ